VVQAVKEIEDKIENQTLGEAAEGHYATLQRAFHIFGETSKFVDVHFYFLWFVVAVLLWYFNPIQAMPQPGEVLRAYQRLFTAKGGSNVLFNTWVTVQLNFLGLLYATIISVTVSYLAVFPACKALNRFIQLLRYAPIIAFSLPFLYVFTIGRPMKIALMTTGMTFFLATAQTSVIEAIPRMKLELAKVLGFNGWGTFKNFILRPTLPDMLEMVRQNSAIGWLMVIAIETSNRTEGGIGAQIYGYQMTGQLPEVYAYLLIIGALALIQDGLFRFIIWAAFAHRRVKERG
jgi:NitT/TauT family transport system permease protein